MKVSGTFNPAVTASLLRKALEGSTTSTPTLMVDGGIENYNTSVDEIVDEGLLKRVLAHVCLEFRDNLQGCRSMLTSFGFASLPAILRWLATKASQADVTQWQHYPDLHYADFGIAATTAAEGFQIFVSPVQ